MFVDRRSGFVVGFKSRSVGSREIKKREVGTLARGMGNRGGGDMQKASVDRSQRK